MGVSFSSNIGGWSKTPIWRVFRFVAIWTALLSIPRMWSTGAPLSSSDLYATVAWLWDLAGEVYRWFGTQTGWY